MSTKKILVVDDDLIHLKLMKKLLGELGHTVVTSDSAEEAEHGGGPQKLDKVLSYMSDS